jgi:outer membrane protein
MDKFNSQRMMNRIFFLVAAVLSGICTGAQNTISLQEAIQTAVKNNIAVRQNDLRVQAATVDFQQAKTNLLPTVNGNISHGMNRGRSIDPFTNAYVDQQISYASYGLGSSVVLFNGASLQNSIKQNAYALDASKMDLQQAKDNLTLNVLLAYLQVLNNEEIVALSKGQVTVSREQVTRLEKLNREGAISPPLLYDLTGELKANELSVITAKNALESSKLALAQLMNIPYNADLRLERVNVDEMLAQYAASPAEVYQKAVHQLAMVKASELRTKSAEAAWRVAKGERYPVLFLNGSLNSNYSSIAARDILLNATETPTADYVLLNGSKVPVIARRNNYASEKISYGSQLKNNVFSNVAVGVRIPIFNGFVTRNRIRLASIAVKNSELAEENTRQQLRQEVDQAYINMNTGWERYKILQDQVAAYAASFRAAEVRFNAGAGTSIDYLVAKNNLDRASINLLIAKYDFVLRKKILDYYEGGLVP